MFTNQSPPLTNSCLIKGLQRCIQSFAGSKKSLLGRAQETHSLARSLPYIHAYLFIRYSATIYPFCEKVYRTGLAGRKAVQTQLYGSPMPPGARLIQKIYHADPLLCPKCHGTISIISFIAYGCRSLWCVPVGTHHRRKSNSQEDPDASESVDAWEP